MKLYAVSDGPPSLAVRMTMKALDMNYQLINVDFCALEHRTEDYAKMNPQKEIPVLDDDGFYLSESIAIMQYLCDKYAASGSTLYPQDVNHRALVNQRLCFNMGFYYAPISAHSMAPIFFDYERTPMSLKKVQNALEVFETYLERLGSKYAAGDDVTIADFALISATICLEAIDFDLSPYPLVNKWYNNFKEEYPQLWEIANSGMQEINAFEHNPPDLSEMEHPFHPTRKAKA
ncbi:glutathione S-transferase 1-1 isoform X2 [Drosophila subobscura]|nr:glutathione S-transferase 1-1 isoform X2 [Drosophila subobscura]